MTLQITLVLSSEPRQVQELSLTLATGSTALQAVMAAELQGIDPSTLAWSIWGKEATPHHVLEEGDRLALCRPLKVDPKMARRERFAKQGSRATGLFAKKKRGVEAGY